LGSLESIFDSTGERCTKTPRKCLNAQTGGIFVCGGRKALCYVPHEDMWYQLEDTTLEHQDHAAIQYRDRVYIFSRQRVVPGQSQIAEYYMPFNNSWGAIQTRFKYDEQFSSLFVLNGDATLYAFTNTEAVPENTIFKYNPVKNEWDKGQALMRWGACSVSDGHYLYIMGGTNRGEKEINATVVVEKVDPNADGMEDVAPMNEARHDAFGAAMNGKIYVAGGLQENGPFYTVLNTCEVYNPSTDEWQLIPSLNVSRYSASMVCFEGALYVVGGLKDKTKSRELSMEMFDSEMNEWKKKSTIPLKDENHRKGEKKFHYKACFATIHKDVLKTPTGN